MQAAFFAARKKMREMKKGKKRRVFCKFIMHLCIKDDILSVRQPGGDQPSGGGNQKSKDKKEEKRWIATHI